MQWGRGLRISTAQRYKGMRLNVISITRGWESVNFPEKALCNTWLAESSRPAAPDSHGEYAVQWNLTIKVTHGTGQKWP